MRVLIINRSASPEGGVERYLADITRLLVGQGAEVDLLFGNGEPSSLFRTARSIPEIWENETALAQPARRRLGELLAELAPDVAYLHDIENGAAVEVIASFAPCVRYIHGYKTTCPDGKRLLLRGGMAACEYPLSPVCCLRAHTRRCMPRSPWKALKSFRRASASLRASSSVARLLVASKFMKKILVLNGVPESRIAILPYFTVWKASDWTPPEKPAGLLFVGRLVPAKGVVELVAMLERMDERFTLDIVGDGPDKGAIASKIEKAGLAGRVKAHGWLEGEALREKYLQNAVLVVPSLWPEPFGIVGLEAAVNCRPAAAFDVGGISDWLIDGKTGVLVEYGRHDLLRSAIERLVADGDKVKTLGLAARDFVTTNFGADLHLNELDRILREESRHEDWHG